MTTLPSIPVLPAGGELRDIPVAAIRAAPRNPRTDADTTSDGLAASLGAGLVHVPIVIAVSNDQYELVDGERRWRAAQAAGHTTMTCMVRARGSPGAILFTQILANLHRADLGPLDESAALKAAWLVLNAQELGLTDHADAILDGTERLRDALAPLRAMLDGAGWHPHMPPVSQAMFIERLGLGMSAAALKKKLQVLAATDAIQAAARRHKLTAAAIRALITLDPDQQETLLAAIDADPTLAKAVRTIVQGVRQKGRTIDEAIRIVSGRDDDDREPLAAPAARAGAASAHAAGGSDASTDGAAPADAPVQPAIDDDAAMDAVLPIIELAQDLQTKLAQLRGLIGPDTTLGDLPQPWGAYASEALRLIMTTIQPYAS